MNLERIFQILAVILIGVAAYFLWRGNNDSLFIAGVVGAVCFFLSIRFQVKERMEQRKTDEEKKREGEGKILESDASAGEDFIKDSTDEERRITNKEKIKTSL